jgi:hypothetical protein
MAGVPAEDPTGTFSWMPIKLAGFDVWHWASVNLAASHLRHAFGSQPAALS